MKKTLIPIFVVTSFLFLAGCNNEQPDFKKNSPYTQGNVQINIKKGTTTQAEVLNVFGAPNIATTDGDGNDVWTYQKNAIITQSHESGSFYATIILVGYGTGSSSGFQQSSDTMTLILKFDKNKKVQDFKCMSTSF